MNIELANGSEGYIPPPEQHALGGYTTWPARTAGLEVQAEPKIVETVLGLLEQVAGKPRRASSLIHGPYAQSVLASQAAGLLAARRHPGTDRARFQRQCAATPTYEGGVAFYLPGARLRRPFDRQTT